jgi:hypothetical protein
MPTKILATAPQDLQTNGGLHLRRVITISYSLWSDDDPVSRNKARAIDASPGPDLGNWETAIDDS